MTIHIQDIEIQNKIRKIANNLIFYLIGQPEGEAILKKWIQKVSC